MPDYSPLFDNYFWKILKFIDGIKSPVSFREMQIVLGNDELVEKDVEQVVEFMLRFDYRAKIVKKNGSIIIEPPKNKPNINIKFSFSDWIALQSHFPVMQELSDFDIHNSCMNKMEKIELDHPELNLMKILSEDRIKDDIIANSPPELLTYIKKIDQAVKRSQLLKVKIRAEKPLEIFPQRIVFLEGELAFVGEETTDRCLVTFLVSEVENIDVTMNLSYVPNFSGLEVDDFIFAVRSLHGTEERIVLKVKTGKPVDLQPLYHFLGNPFVTSNMDGDLIWAASLEVSDHLFEWLDSIKDHIEILDPQEIKASFAEYSQAKEEMRKKDLKKSA